MTDATNRARVSKGVPQGGEFATEAKAENPDLVTTEPHVLSPIMVTPVKTVGDREMRGKVMDLAAILANLDEDERAPLLERCNRVRFSNSKIFLPHEVRTKAFEAGLTDANTALEVDAMALRQFLADHPAWVSDGVTPHPTGGYVYVDADALRTHYLDANFSSHRLDGPAIVRKERKMLGERGEEIYAEHGVVTRAGGHPAVVRSDGTREWWIDGVKVGELTILRKPHDELLMD